MSNTPCTWATHATYQAATDTVPLRYLRFDTPERLRLYTRKLPIIAVTLVEDAAGTYMGWIPADKPEAPTAVQRAEIFDIQFTYGHQVEEERGKGHAIRLRVEPVA